MGISDSDINEQPADDGLPGNVAGDADGADGDGTDTSDSDSNGTDSADTDGTDSADTDGTDGDSDGADS